MNYDELSQFVSRKKDGSLSEFQPDGSWLTVITNMRINVNHDELSQFVSRKKGGSLYEFR